MKNRYDFSNAEQGRFYTKSEDMLIAHYLKPAVEMKLRSIAKIKGTSTEELLEAIVEKEVALLEKLG
jgi:hypothetical protein